MAAALGFVLGAIAPAFAQARLDAVDGTVEIRAAGESAWKPAAAGTALGEGDAVRTKSGSAGIVFADQGRATLGADGALTLEKLKGAAAVLALDAGGLAARPGPRPSVVLRVKTTEAVAAARGAGFQVETAAGQTRIEATNGVVAVKIKSGESAELGPDRPYRSLLVIPGWPMSLLPHPREADASAQKDADGLDLAGSAGTTKVLGSSDLESALAEAQRPGRLIRVSDEDLKALDPGSARAIREMQDALNPLGDGGKPGLNSGMLKALRQALAGSPRGASPEVQAVLDTMGRDGKLSTADLKTLIKAGLKPADLSLDPSKTVLPDAPPAE